MVVIFPNFIVKCQVNRDEPVTRLKLIRLANIDARVQTGVYSFGAGWICKHCERCGCVASGRRNNHASVAPALGSPPRALLARWGGGAPAGAFILKKDTSAQAGVPPPHQAKRLAGAPVPVPQQSE